MVLVHYGSRIDPDWVSEVPPRTARLTAAGGPDASSNPTAWAATASSPAAGGSSGGSASASGGQQRGGGSGAKLQQTTLGFARMEQDPAKQKAQRLAT